MDNTVFVKDIHAGMKNINITFIVLDIGLPVTLKEGREVRSLKVADATACINLSLWDEPGQLLMPGDIVKLTKGYASIWRNCLTLYSGKNGDVEKLGDFCMVFNESLDMSLPTSNSVNQNSSCSFNSTVNNGNSNNRSSNPKVHETHATSNNAAPSKFTEPAGKLPSKSTSRGRGSMKNAPKSERR
ncbi:unnamed protein product [Bemisia tabaci]|uniref:Uncharacterized protein n=1 Tax=Bemisia tabaci TaxID=7038 RepID=A0A9P0F3T9_BEMTA|nr:unnamed protein product [Bemisia tabaci]